MCIARATSLRVGTQCVYDVVNNDDVLYILFIGFVRKKKKYYLLSSSFFFNLLLCVLSLFVLC